jgi:glycosyltransferase involved in cell wall biosynthesis
LKGQVLSGKNKTLDAKISIVIPVFNRERLLRECLESLARQSLEVWEAIIVDDGSSDGSVAVAEEFAGSDARFRVMTRPVESPKGACACRNVGLREARGKYVIFLDSDDLLAVEALESRASFLEENPGLDFCISGTLVFDHKLGDVSRYRCFPEKTEDSDFMRFLVFDQPWLTTGPTWRREFLRTKKLWWDESLPCWQDWFFHLEALCHTHRYRRLAGSDSGWRRGLSGKISKPGKTNPGDFQGFFSPLEERLDAGKAQGIEVDAVLPVIFDAAVRMPGFSGAVFDYSHRCQFRDYAHGTALRRFLCRSQSLPRRVRGRILKTLRTREASLRHFSAKRVSY